MDSMERSHELESFVISSLFDTRQLIWAEFSSVISNIKNHFDQSTKEHNHEIERLVDENRSLKELLNRFKTIVEGKELEINGLRRQLQSFCSGHPQCYSCSIQIHVAESALENKGQTYNQERISSRKTYHLPAYTSKQHKCKKRFSGSLGSPSSDACSKPIRSKWGVTGEVVSIKRLCLRSSPPKKPTAPISHDHKLPKPEVDTQQVETINTQDDLPNTETPVSRIDASNRANFELSPPTQQYDPSVAIRNAVNHLDLPVLPNTAAVNSVVPFATQSEEDTLNDQSSISLSVASQSTSKFTFQRPVKRRPQQLPTHSLLRRRLGLGLPSRLRQQQRLLVSHKRNARRVVPKSNGGLARATAESSNETERTLSASSDFLQSEQSELPTKAGASKKSTPQSAAVPPDRETLKPANSKKDLPSLGASPTQPVFKRPLEPVTQRSSTTHLRSPRPLNEKPTDASGKPDKVAATDNHRHSHRCSRHRVAFGSPPSTPTGFWDIDISNSENVCEQTENVTKRYTFRRRRPLNFPKCSDSPTSKPSLQ